MASVGIAQFRRELKTWIAKAADGEEIILKDRGVPVARLTDLSAESTIQRLVDSGVVTPPSRAREPIDPTERITPRTSVSDLILQERERRRG